MYDFQTSFYTATAFFRKKFSQNAQKIFLIWFYKIFSNGLEEETSLMKFVKKQSKKWFLKLENMIINNWVSWCQNVNKNGSCFLAFFLLTVETAPGVGPASKPGAENETDPTDGAGRLQHVTLKNNISRLMS